MGDILRRRGMMKAEGLSTIIWRLASEKYFNGSTDFIDTGIKLCETDETYTIAIDFTNGSLSGAYTTLFYCIYESRPFPGISFQRYESNNYYMLGGDGHSKNFSGIPTTSGKKIKFVLSREKNTNKFNVFYTVDGGNYEKVSITGSCSTSNKNMLIGCYQTTNGTKGRYWNGTVHDFTIYNYAMTDEQAISYVSGGM